MDFVNLFLILVWCHFLADYALQGDFMSKAKNPLAPIPNVPPQLIMFSHAFIQAGPVYYFTGLWWLGLLELMHHYATDDAKCRGKLTFLQDQLSHIIAKFVWVLTLFGGIYLGVL